jgi:tetratricopeptide (TPR) repeat protein
MAASIPHGEPSRGQLAAACDELERRLRAGEPCSAASLLAEFPILAADKTAALELIHTEHVIREELGQRPSADEWYARFPQWAADLRERFEVNAHLRAEVGGPPTAAWEGSPPTTPAAEAPTAVPWEGRQIGGYEVLGQLGRGGMGAVYKARQVALNRIVALKVILGGEHADPHARSRFRREAEAVARLDHPNIVRIYEVGEHDGSPYFSMEYVDGGTLAAELAGGPLPPRRAAGLVADLAAAVEYAHRRGVIHRDLKPANVLLQTDDSRLKIEATGVFSSQSSIADHQSPIPKVTDFGLAKLFAGDGTPTVTGHLLGTPCYMAPEQASGDAKRVGPAADTYALGAILYECLTGRPPFQGASNWVIWQVLDSAPVPLSRVRPGVPRDLETICLKCLEKDPARRYPTAGALADDLRRFLNDQPIRARPPGAIDQLRKFARRNRAAVAGAAAVFVVLILGLVGTTVGLIHADAARVRAETAEQEARAQSAESHARAADLAMQRGAWRAALESLDRALDGGHPDVVRLRLMKVRARFAVREVPQAVAELRELAAGDDLGELEGQVLLLQADLALAREADDGALRLVERARARGLPLAEEAYANGLLAATVPEAVGHFRAALDHDRFHHRATGMLIALLLLRGELTEARGRAALARQLFPEDPTFAILLALVHAAGGDGPAARAELDRARSQLRAPQVAAVEALLELVRRVRTLEVPLARGLGASSGLSEAFVLPAVRTGLEAIRTLRGDPGNGGDLLAPVPPVLSRLLDRAAVAAGGGIAAPGGRARVIEALQEMTRAHPDGLLLDVLGEQLTFEERFAEAEESFRGANVQQAFLPVRRPALYGLVFCQWELADRRGGMRVYWVAWMRRAIENVRRLAAYDNLTLQEVKLIAGVANAAGDYRLGRWVIGDWDQRNGRTTDRTLLQLWMKAEYETGADQAAIDLADRILADYPDDRTALAYRAAARDRVWKTAWRELLRRDP